jgi:hypothetical protein
MTVAPIFRIFLSSAWGDALVEEFAGHGETEGANLLSHPISPVAVLAR